MAQKISVAVLIGSLRRESYTRKIAEAAIARAGDGLACVTFEIGDLPHYNQDLDGTPPAAWERFRAEVGAADAVLFFTPEYNRSFPGVLKNAIDIASRPEGHNLWNRMPAGVVGVTPYRLGGMAANHALRQTFVFLNMAVMQQPEAYIGQAADALDENGKLKDDKIGDLLGQFMSSFENWARLVLNRPQ
ncbi:MAG TPA: NAD(P)H-dependent oxidoreductase [Herbaspirillum sp.]|jgi:NAD(P)H-dependent FMN reductase